MPMTFDDKTVEEFLEAMGCPTHGTPEEKRERAASKSVEMGDELQAWEIRTGKPWDEMTQADASALISDCPRLLRNPAVRNRIARTSIQPGDLVIINHWDKPCGELVVVVTEVSGDDITGEYISVEIAQGRVKGRRDDVTLLEEFGRKIAYKNRTVTIEKNAESTAQYWDGDPRRWQGADVEYVALKPEIDRKIRCRKRTPDGAHCTKHIGHTDSHSLLCESGLPWA